MPTCCSRVLAGGRCTLHGKVHPTPATMSIRMLLAMAAAKDGELRHFDAEQAFFKADIDEEIYIEIPEEFQEFPGAVGRLNKAIYGLVQAGRYWNNKLCDDITAIGFEQAKLDPCMFSKVVDVEAEMVLVVHIYGILAHAKDQATMDRFAAELGQKFKLKDMDDAGYYMGCHITSNRKARALKLDQHLYVELMVKRFDVKEVTKIPAASGVPTLSKVDEPRSPEEKEEIRKLPYREAVAALMWTATMTRPDIACAVRAVARFCENPGPAHKKAVVKILEVSPSHERMEVTYGGQGCGLCMEANTDSDFRACLDTRRSVSGAVDAGERGEQLALKDARSDSIEYLGCRVRCFIRGGKGSSTIEAGAGIHGTVDEGRCSEYVRRQ